MSSLFGFIKKIGSFYRFWRDYEYDGDCAAFIVEQYQSVMSNRTRFLSKPTYSAQTVIAAIDEWYEKVYEECKEDDEKIESFELDLKDFCDGCGHFCADVEKIDVTTMEDMLNHEKRFRTYIKCSKHEVCEHVLKAQERKQNAEKVQN